MRGEQGEEFRTERTQKRKKEEKIGARKKKRRLGTTRSRATSAPICCAWQVDAGASWTFSKQHPGQKAGRTVKKKERRADSKINYR